jgi:hypothetical protein
MASLEFFPHPCSCPREKQKIVSRNGYNNLDEQSFEFEVCTNCGVSNCKSTDPQNVHYHNWNACRGMVGNMFILKCNIRGCNHKVYVCCDKNQHYLDESVKSSKCKKSR